jgi:glycosyltransferase involved in cell wall biosynthesis
LRVTLDARLILPQMTGIGRYLMGLLGGMQEVLYADQLQVWVQNGLPSDHAVWSLNGGQVRISRIPLHHMDWRAQWTLPLMLHQNSPDLLHYPHFDLPWFTPGKVVLTIHDLKYISQAGFLLGAARLKSIVMKTMLLHAARSAQAVIVDSQFTAQDLMQRMKIEAEKIHVIPLGVNERFFRKCHPQVLEQVRKRYRLPEQYLLTVGERRPHKNLINLIQAFALYQKTSRLSQRLVIAGKAYADYREPQKLVEKLRLVDQVHFLDYVDDADLPALYQMADAFVLLSYYEGFGLPVLEAMASGALVIASNCTALPEVAGENALLVDPRDPQAVSEALHLLLTTESLCEELTRKAQIWAQQFTWRRCAEQTLDCYHQVGTV